MIPSSLKELLIPLIGDISATSTVGGGCIHHAVRLKTQSGPFFLKWNEASHAHNFQVEAKGLALLAETQSIPTPRVLHQVQTDQYAGMVLEWVEQGHPANDYHKDFGEKLGQLHLHTAPYFGLAYENYIGSLPQFNGQQIRGSDFFREARLLPQLQMPKAKALLSSHTQKGFEVLFSKLDSLIPEEAPALLHGDLWGGNILRGPKGYVTVIDPAVYYGHREAEIAFMQMFDHYPESFYEAYHSVRPLAPGWQKRVDLFNLYPLLVHVNLFGGGYVNSVERIINRYR